MNFPPETFRPTPTDPDSVKRLAEQRERARVAVLVRNGGCPVCEAPRPRWPMAHRGDRACSIQCEKTLRTREDQA